MVAYLPKYFNPIRYFRKAERLLAKFVLWIGIPLSVVSKVDRFTIKFIATSYLEYHLRAKQGYKREPITVHWIIDVIGIDDTVYDVGANVGTYSLLIGKRAEAGSGTVLAFEPEASNFSSLNKNIILNGLQDKVVPYAVAFGNTRRVTSFFLSSTTPGSSCHSIDGSESEGKPFTAKHTQGAYVVTIDDFVAESGVPFPNHIKIDVDGAEGGIVAGMKNTLADIRLQTIMIEITEETSLGEVEKEILESGFREEIRQQWENKNMSNILYIRQ